MRCQKSVELGWSLTEVSTGDLIGISNQIKVLLTPYWCAFCPFFSPPNTHSCKPDVATTAWIPYVGCARCAVSFSCRRSSHGVKGLCFLENRHPLCILYAFLLPNSTGVAGCWSDCAAVGPLSPCAPWLEGAGSPWLNPAVVKVLGGGPSICIAK